MKNSEKGQTFIILLIAVVIISFLTIKFLLPKGGKEAIINEPPTQTIDRSKDINCANNLKTVRIAIEIYKTTEGNFPSSLSELYPAFIDRIEYLKCPLSGESYRYDSLSGIVKCSYQGHENF